MCGEKLIRAAVPVMPVLRCLLILPNMSFLVHILAHGIAAYTHPDERLVPFSVLSVGAVFCDATRQFTSIECISRTRKAFSCDSTLS